VRTSDQRTIGYDYMIVATGMRFDFASVKGLEEALEHDGLRVLSMYGHDLVQKVFPAIQAFKQGNALFTFPKVPIKCAGAPQKIMYLAEDYFRKNNVRDKINVSYFASTPVIFGVKKYAEALMQIVKERGINFNASRNLVEVNHKTSTALFQDMTDPSAEKFEETNYDLLHVCPPMKPVSAISSNAKLADSTGYLDVSKETLQHTTYPNIFGLGDCTNAPTSKTAAAVAAQSRVLFDNLSQVIKSDSSSDSNRESPIHLKSVYDGYTSCPLVTGYGKLMLAEFDYAQQPLETFPVDQSKESRAFYHLKRDLLPELYWNGSLKGIWNGPESMRNAMSFMKQ